MFHRKSSVELGALTFSLTFKIRTQSSNHIYSTWDAGLETGSTSEWTRFEGKREDTDKGPWMHQLAGAAAHLHGVLATPVCSLVPFSPHVSLSSLLLNTSAPLDTSLTCATLVHSPLAASQLLPLMWKTNTLYKPHACLWSQPHPQTPASLLFAFILIMENLNTHSIHHDLQLDQYGATKHGLSSEFTVLLWIMEPLFKYTPPHAGQQFQYVFTFSVFTNHISWD